MVKRWNEPSDRTANFVLAAIVLVSCLVALAWVFYVPMFEAPGRIGDLILEFVDQYTAPAPHATPAG